MSSDRQHPYVLNMIGCGHGVLFSDPCRDCEIVGLMDEYKRAVRTVQRVRDRMRVLGSPMPGQTSIMDKRHDPRTENRNADDVARAHAGV